MNEKNCIRKQMRETLSKLTKPLYEDLSTTIAYRLYEHPDWKEAQVIGITISMLPEVDTYQIIKKSWELGKQVVIPKCSPKEKKLSFRTLTAFSQLESVFHGLLEPIEAETIEVGPDQIELLIVPGLAYTREGYRIGFGGGYYDRFLKDYHGSTISLAFNSQVIPHIPVEVHDVPVSTIITNNEVIEKK
jgi:5-formyltetrahydrofolate cyclo-ligase